MCVCVYRKNKADVGFCTITVSGSHWGSWNISFLDKGGGCVTVFQYFNNWVSLWYTHFGRRQWHPTPVLLPGKIPWAEEPGGLQSMGSWIVGHDWATSLSFSLSCIGKGNGNPLQCSCQENPRDGGAWWAAVYGVAQSRTRLKWLSSSSISSSNV